MSASPEAAHSHHKYNLRCMQAQAQTTAAEPCFTSPSSPTPSSTSDPTVIACSPAATAALQHVSANTLGMFNKALTITSQPTRHNHSDPLPLACTPPQPPHARHARPSSNRITQPISLCGPESGHPRDWAMQSPKPSTRLSLIGIDIHR